MKDTFNQYFENDLIVFSVDIKQTRNKSNELKKQVFFPKNWEKSKLSVNNYKEKKNGLALLTGKPNNIFVVDIDNVQHWKDFLKKNGKKEPKTVKAKSASGGIHLYFKYSDDLENIKTSTHSFGKEYDIDIRSNGGCIFVPPSSYYDGKTEQHIAYEWSTSIFEEEPIKLPEWMLMKLTDKNYESMENKKSTTITKSQNQNEQLVKVDHVMALSKRVSEKNTLKKSVKDTEKTVSKSCKTKIIEELDDDNEEADDDKQSDECDDHDKQSGDDDDYDNDEITKMLDLLSPKRIDDYDNWITAGMAIYNSSNGKSFSVWDAWSKKNSKYDDAVCKQKWRSFKNKSSNEGVTLGTIMYWCKKDSPHEYKDFKIKRKTDQMILQKYPDLELDLGGTIEVSGRKCTILNNDKCIFFGKSHDNFEKPMFINIHNGIMEIVCRHFDCIGKTFPCPPIRLTKNEMNIMNCGTVNVTINNYSNPDDQLIEFQKYDIFENETVNELVYKSLTGTHTSMADIVYYYFKEKYNVGEDNNWYIYENHKWNLIGFSNEYFSAELQKKLESIYNRLIDYGKQIKMDNEKIKEFKKIYRMFGIAQSKRDIMSVTKENFKANNNLRRDFVKNLDSDRTLIVFNNGVYDLKTHEFRDGKQTDNMSLSVNYDYISKHSKNYNQLTNFLSDIQPDKNDREFLLTYLSHALYGNTLEWFTILIGGGRNGKSKLIELLSTTFGDYYESVKSQLFTRPQPDANSPDPGLLNLRNKKIVVSNEPDKRSKLNSGFIKFMTGRDSVKLRECHGNKMIQFSPKFITIFVCNDIPDTDELDNAFSKRLRCVNFPTEFREDPDPLNEKQKQIDTNINEKFDVWRADFMLLLIEYYKKYMENKKIIVTDNVLKWTNQYKEETDLYLMFLFTQCLLHSILLLTFFNRKNVLP